MNYGISTDEAVEAFSKLSRISATCFEEIRNAPVTTIPYEVESFGGYTHVRYRPVRCEYCGVTTDKKTGLCDYCGAPL